MVFDFNDAPRQEEFQTGEVAKITGVKRPRLQPWIEKGWIVPTVQKADGHGVPNVFDRNDLYWIKIFADITEKGLPRKTVADILAKLKELSAYSLCGCDDGVEYVFHTIFYATKGEESRATLISGPDFEFGATLKNLGLKGYDYAFVFNTVSSIESVDVKIKELFG